MNTTESAIYSPHRFAVADLLPQSGPMVLIDGLLSIDSETVTTFTTIRDDGLFSLPDNTVPAWVGIEYMAQTIAAFSGYHCLMRGEPIRLGLLLGTREFNSVHSEYTCGTVLHIHAKKIIESANDMCVFDSTISLAGKNNTDSMQSAQAKINLLIPKDLDAFLNNNNQTLNE